MFKYTAMLVFWKCIFEISKDMLRKRRENLDWLFIRHGRHEKVYRLNIADIKFSFRCYFRDIASYPT